MKNISVCKNNKNFRFMGKKSDFLKYFCQKKNFNP